MNYEDSERTAYKNMATFDGSDEPLFADDLSDDDLPPLPPPIAPRSDHSNSRIESNSNSGTTGNWQSQSNHTSEGNDKGTTPTRKRGQHGNNVGGATDGVGQGRGEDDNEDAAPPAKKVRQPLLTFKMNRLFSDDGFPYIVKEFPKLKFKGKGQEANDLKFLLHQYEEWANHLFPKLTFMDFCKKVEAMAKKNEFKYQVNMIRRQSTGLDTGDHDDETERLSPELEDLIPGLGTEEHEDVVNERLSPELEDSIPGLGTEEHEDVVNERLSPELEDMDLFPHQSNENSEQHSGEGTPSLSDGNTVLASSNQTKEQQFIPPDPWDVIDEEQDIDPYEDFPDL